MLSPMIAAIAATAITATMLSLPLLASSEAANRAVSPSTGTPEGSDPTSRPRTRYARAGETGRAMARVVTWAKRGGAALGVAPIVPEDAQERPRDRGIERRFLLPFRRPVLLEPG